MLTALVSLLALGECPASLNPLGAFHRDIGGMQCINMQKPTLGPKVPTPTTALECASACRLDDTCDLFQWITPGGCGSQTGLGCWVAPSKASSPQECNGKPQYAPCLDGAAWADFGCTVHGTVCPSVWVGCSKHSAVPGGDPYDPLNPPPGASMHSGALGFGWLAIIIGASLLVVASLAFVGGGAAINKVALKRSGAEMWTHMACVKHFILLVWDGTLTALTCGKKQLTRTKMCGTVEDKSAYDAYLDGDHEEDGAARRGSGGVRGGGTYQASSLDADLDDDDL